jgi:GWxTD domain-containing protein
MRRARAAAVLLAFAAVLASGAAGPAIPKLSKKERAERLRLMPEEERNWLEDVRPIILPDEEDFFLLLTQPHEREIFKEEFWKRRERAGLVFPLGPGYRRRYEELLRIADEKYDGRRQDAGRMVIVHGEPAAIDPLDGCGDLFRDLQIWTYQFGADRSVVRHYFFTRRSPGAPRKLWTIADADSEILQPGACRKRLADLHFDCGLDNHDPCLSGGVNCPSACHVFEVWSEIRAQQGSSLGARNEYGMTLASPEIDLEGLELLAARFPAIRDPRARPIGVEAPSSVPVMPPSLAPSPLATLSPEEIRERILALRPKYREWLYLAAPLLVGDELSRFLQMSDSGKDDFIRGFWKRRSK